MDILKVRSEQDVSRIVAATAIEARKHERFVYDLLPPLVSEALRYGVDPVVILAQSVHETGWGEFGGIVPPHYHNTCGLKTGDGGGNEDPDAHQRFPSWHAGARAHAQHLRTYAGKPIQHDLILTPRAHLVQAASEIHGPAVTVEQLGGRWAPSSTYGNRIEEKALTLLERAGVAA